MSRYRIGALGVALLLAAGVAGGLPAALGADPVFHVVPQTTLMNPGTGTEYLVAGTTGNLVDVTLDLSQGAGQQVWGTEFRIDVRAGVPITLTAAGAPPYTNDVFAGFNLLAGFNTVRVGQLSGRTTDIIANGTNYGPLTGTGKIVAQYTANATAPLVGTTTYAFDNDAVYVGGGTITHSVVNPAFGIVARGDVDFSGTLTQSDLNTLAGNFGTLSGATWGMGDFNGDGKVNLMDLALFTQSYQQWGGGLPLSSPTPDGQMLTVVPEPAGFALTVGLAGVLLLRRSRRRGAP